MVAEKTISTWSTITLASNRLDRFTEQIPRALFHKAYGDQYYGHYIATVVTCM